MHERRRPPAPGFEPVQRAGKTRMVAAVALGPLLWVVALLVVAIVVHRTDEIFLALLIAASALVLGLAWMLIQRDLRLRRERETP